MSDTEQQQAFGADGGQPPLRFPGSGVTSALVLALPPASERRSRS